MLDLSSTSRVLRFTGRQSWSADHKRRRELIEALATGVRDGREGTP